jgi:hypothetical protein
MRVVATGRGGFPNRLNNSLVFPAIFRGALDVRATQQSCDSARPCRRSAVNRAPRSSLATTPFVALNDGRLHTMAPKPQDNTGDMRSAAFMLLARGWSVIPIEARGKRPIVPWLEHQSRLATEKEVEAWFGGRRNSNLGIVTGALSNLVVLDIDARHRGSQSLALLELEHGTLPDTVEAQTGGAGRHLYFVHPGGVVHNRVGLAAGIDFRGDGGCVVVPPSVHPSGRRYKWLPHRSPQEIPLAALPPWLLRFVNPSESRVGHPLSYWRNLVREGVVEGSRNSTLASLAGHLLRQGVDPQVALELLLAWNGARCRPPLAGNEVAQVVDSIARLHQQKRKASLTRGSKR